MKRAYADTFYTLVIVVAIVFAAYVNFRFYSFPGKNIPEIKKGVLDLRNTDLDQLKIIKLKGESEFYWNNLLFPADSSKTFDALPKSYWKIDDVWNNFKYQGKKVGASGFATYRWHIFLPENGEYGISLKDINSNYRLWIDGKKVAHAGKVGKIKSDSKMEWSRNICFFNYSGKPIEFVLQVSNYRLRKGGAEESILIGKSEYIQANRNLKLRAEFFLLAIFFIIFIQLLGTFLLYPKNKSSLYFSLLAYSAGMFLLFTSERSGLVIFPQLNGEWSLRLVYIAANLIILFSLFFHRSFFHELFDKLLFGFFVGVHFITIIYILIMPAPQYSFASLVIPFAMILAYLYICIVLYKAMINKREYSVLLFTAAVIYFLFMVHDILHFFLIVKTPQMVSYAMFIMIIIMYKVYATQWANSLINATRLSVELEDLNKNLEKTIELKTREITLKNVQLEKQTNQLKENLVQLNRLNQFKETFTHMLVHDLKVPLNILLNLPDKLALREKENTLKSTTSNMLNLVLNILDVRKFEDSKSTVQKEHFFVRTVVDEIVSNLSFQFQDRYIDLSVEVEKNIHLFADRQLLKRVITNLLVNALKYVATGGKISIIGQIQKNDTTFFKLEIEDNGRGIAKKDIDKVFNLYESKDEGLNYSTGIGLAFCKYAIEAHDGKIGLSSKIDKGTKVWFTVPNAEKADTFIPKTENFILNDTHLYKGDIARLKRYYTELNEMDISEITRFQNVYKQLAKLELENKNWLKALKKSVFSGNIDLYKKLVKNIVAE